jgi:hypothetical protein
MRQPLRLSSAEKSIPLSQLGEPAKTLKVACKVRFTNFGRLPESNAVTRKSFSRIGLQSIERGGASKTQPMHKPSTLKNRCQHDAVTAAELI